MTDANPEFTRAALDEPETPVEPEPEGDGGSANVEPDGTETVVMVGETGEVMTEADEDFDGDPVPQEVPTPAPMTEIEKLQAIATEKEVELLQAQKDNDAAKINADRLANEVTAINAEIQARTPWDRHGQTAGIKDYIASQNDLRLQRADRMNKFIAATGGATPGELRKALDARSALDVAMAGRKPARGARRPEVRVPASGL